MQSHLRMEDPFGLMKIFSALPSWFLILKPAEGGTYLVTVLNANCTIVQDAVKIFFYFCSFKEVNLQRIHISANRKKQTQNESHCQLVPLLFLTWNRRYVFSFFINIIFVAFSCKHAHVRQWNVTSTKARKYFDKLKWKRSLHRHVISNRYPKLCSHNT